MFIRLKQIYLTITRFELIVYNRPHPRISEFIEFCKRCFSFFQVPIHLERNRLAEITTMSRNYTNNKGLLRRTKGIHIGINSFNDNKILILQKFT